MTKLILLVLILFPMSCVAKEDPKHFTLHLAADDGAAVDEKLHKKVMAAYRSQQPEPLWILSQPVLDERSIEKAFITIRPAISPELKSLMQKNPKVKAQVLELQIKGALEDEPEVNIKFTDVAKDKLADFTSKNIGKRVVMILDGVVVQAPVLRDPLLTGEAIINGIPRDQMDKFVRRLNEISRRK